MLNPLLLVDKRLRCIFLGAFPSRTPPPEFIGVRRSKTESFMSFDSAGATASAPLPLQFVNIEITPLIDGQYGVAMQATLLDEDELQFVGQDLASARVATLEEVFAIIRANVGPLAAAHAA